VPTFCVEFVYGLFLLLFPLFLVIINHLVGERFGQRTLAITHKAYERHVMEAGAWGEDYWAFDEATYLLAPYAEGDALDHVVVTDVAARRCLRHLTQRLRTEAERLEHFLRNLAYAPRCPLPRDIPPVAGGGQHFAQ
jgi:hypothetical protein